MGVMNDWGLPWKRPVTTRVSCGGMVRGPNSETRLESLSTEKISRATAS